MCLFLCGTLVKEKLTLYPTSDAADIGQQWLRYLMAPSHYLNQWWLRMVNNHPRKCTKLHKLVEEIYLFKDFFFANLPRGQWVRSWNQVKSFLERTDAQPAKSINKCLSHNELIRKNHRLTHYIPNILQNHGINPTNIADNSPLANTEISLPGCISPRKKQPSYVILLT